MAKISFAKTNAAGDSKPVVTTQEVQSETPKPIPVATAGVIPPATTACSAVMQASPQPVSTFVGEDESIDIKDIILPRLNIVQRIGDLSTRFTPGDVLLNGELVISVPHAKDKAKDAQRELVELVVLGFLPKQYVERTTNNEQGNTAKSTHEVVQLGGTIDYNEAKQTSKPWYQTLATAVVLIKKPSHIKDDSAFTLEHAGVRHGIALWGMKGAAYTKGAKVIYTARSKFGRLKDGYTDGGWILDTDPNYESGGNVIVAPILKSGSPTTPEFRAFAKSIFS